MANALARISGHITHVERRSGRTGDRDWAFTEATLLVAQRETTKITVDDALISPREGDEVDYLVQLSSGRGDTIRIRAVADYPAFSPAA